jgi:hypothetical protein
VYEPVDSDETEQHLTCAPLPLTCTLFCCIVLMLSAGT